MLELSWLVCSYAPGRSLPLPLRGSWEYAESALRAYGVVLSLLRASSRRGGGGVVGSGTLRADGGVR